MANRRSAAVARARLRLAAATVATAAVVGAAWGGPLGEPAPSTSGSVLAGRSVYVVLPGDTFWSIARRVQPEGDVRPLVDRLVRAHGGSGLQVGDRIVLPGSHEG